MKFPNQILVTDREVNLTSLQETHKQYYFKLTKTLKDIYLSSGKDRYLISLSGPSGSGKSVLSKILEEILKNDNDFDFTYVDLDAFHLTNSTLIERKLNKVKGRYDTYNTTAVFDLLVKFKNNEDVQFPRYSRKDHEPHRDGPIINSGKHVLLVSGLWLNLNHEQWLKIRNLFDLTMSIDGTEENFRKNTINRHVVGGRTKEDAEKFYKESDLKNTEVLLKNSLPSDLVIKYYEDIK